MPATVLLALGSNRRGKRGGRPPGVLAAALAALATAGVRVVAVSRIRATAPLGPGSRAYANAVAVVETRLGLPALLRVLKVIEAAFGRRPGRRWGDRVLDLDILAAGDAVLPGRHRWRTASRGLVIPHRALHVRRFVLAPLAELAPGWRHPVLGATARQLHARSRRPKATPVT